MLLLSYRGPRRWAHSFVFILFSLLNEVAVVSRLTLAVIFLILAGLAAWLLFTEPNTEGRAGRGGGEVTVVTAQTVPREFADLVEALGTARARESVTIASRVTDTVEAVHFEDGDVVKAGDLLVELIATEEQAQLKEARGNMLEANRNFSRTQDLLSRGNTTEALLDEARRRRDESASRLAAAEARIADRQIRAPFDGLLGLRQVSAGSLVTTNSRITTIDAIDVINLDFAVPERFIAVLGRGQMVEAKVEAYPGRLFEGRVKTIDSRVDPATRSVVVRAEIDNQDLLLRPGMLMTVEVTSRVWTGLSVPEQSVVPQAGQDYVYVVAGDEAERRPVSLGARVPGFVEVTSGLTAGEPVVIEGTQRLGRSGIKVRALNKPAVSAPDGSQGGDAS